MNLSSVITNAPGILNELRFAQFFLIKSCCNKLRKDGNDCMKKLSLLFTKNDMKTCEKEMIAVVKSLY